MNALCFHHSLVNKKIPILVDSNDLNYYFQKQGYQTILFDDYDFASQQLAFAVISDYGSSGFPVSLISRRWNQIWPERPFPTEYVIEYQAKCKSNDGVTVQKKVNLLKYLKWKCKGSNIQFCNTEKGVVLVDKSKT